MNNDIYFPVRKVETAEILPEMLTNSENEYAVVAELPEGEKLITLCSERLNLVPNEALYPELERLFSLNPATKDFKVRTKSVDHKDFYREYSFPKFESFVGNKKDGLIAGLGVGNSYYGQMFNGSVNAHRMVCSNGLWGVASLMKISNKHTQIVQGAIQDLFIQAMEAIEEFAQQIERYNVLASAVRGLDWEDRLDDVADKSGIKKFHDDAKAIVRKEAGDLYGGVVNDWLIYNALNQTIFNDGLNKKNTGVRQKLDEKVFNHMLMTV